MISTSDFEIWNLRFELFQQETQAVNSPSQKNENIEILKNGKIKSAVRFFIIFHLAKLCFALGEAYR